MISDEIKLILAAAVVMIAAALGFHLGSLSRDAEITKIRAGYTEALGKSQEALTAANAHTAALDRSHAAELVATASTYESLRQNEKAITDRRVADLANDNTRLRVSTNHRAACGGQLPNAAADPSRSDGEATETLSRSVAARLARRYADYNEIVDQLDLCQQVLLIDRK